MKLRQKIFVNFLILFLLVFNLGAIIIIQNTHNISLGREIDRGLTEHLSIDSGIKAILSINKDKQNNYNEKDDAILNPIIKAYLSSFNNKDISIELLDGNNNEIFDNININISGEREELENPLLDKRQYIIRDIDEKTYLFVTNLMNIGYKNFKFSYIRDISQTYKDRTNQYLFFCK